MAPRHVSLASELLRQWREKRELNQTQMGQLIGIDLVRVSKFERGALTPGRKLALRIERATSGAVPVGAWDEPTSASKIEAKAS